MDIIQCGIYEILALSAWQHAVAMGQKATVPEKSGMYMALLAYSVASANEVIRHAITNGFIVRIWGL